MLVTKPVAEKLCRLWNFSLCKFHDGSTDYMYQQPSIVVARLARDDIRFADSLFDEVMTVEWLVIRLMAWSQNDNVV